MNIKAVVNAIYVAKIIIPDNSSGKVGFMIIASALTSIAYPPLATIPLFICSWVSMDLFLNNRNVAKDFNAKLSMFEEELREERKV